MGEGTFELHPGDALFPETVLELSLIHISEPTRH